jgi:hypothetical protein
MYSDGTLRVVRSVAIGYPAMVHDVRHSGFYTQHIYIGIGTARHIMILVEREHRSRIRVSACTRIALQVALRCLLAHLDRHT